MNKKNNREHIQYVRKYINLINKLSQHQFPGVDISHVNQFESKVVKWLECEPLSQVIRRIKEMRLTVMRFLSNEIYQPSFISTKRGLPTCIPFQLREGIHRGSQGHIKIVLTLLYISREWQDDLKPDYTVITTPNDPCIDGLTPYIQDFIKEFNLRVSCEPWNLFFLTTKQGPNGHALAWSLREAAIISEELVSQITTFSPTFADALSSCRKYSLEKLPDDVKDKIYRKVVPIQDKEGKTRLIGILDYWSQSVLKPLHDSLMGNLKKFKSDMTMNQTGHGHGWFNSQKLFSFDLVNATDRFPINIQYELMKALIGEERASMWVKIMTGHEFTSPSGPLRYCAGQPMGAYSSWPAFTLTHHFLVYVAGRKAGSGNYIMLGDDIVIAGESLAQQYSDIIKGVGVNIAEHKTFKSYDFYEFAKRSYYKGMDVTPYHLGAILTCNTLTEWVTEMSKLTGHTSFNWPEDLMIALARIKFGNTVPDWKIRQCLNKLYAFDSWPLLKDGTPTHNLERYVRRVIPAPCGQFDFMLSKLSKAIKLAMQNTLIEQCNTLDMWFIKLKERRISSEDWVSLNLPGNLLECVPLEVIYEREKSKFKQLLEKCFQDSLFLGIEESYGELLKIIISNPLLLASERRHLVTNQAVMLLSTKVLTILQKIRDRDIKLPITPLQAEVETISNPSQDFLDDFDMPRRIDEDI
jgi:hypothetical protein